MSDGQSATELIYDLPRELDLLAAETLKEKLLDYLHQEGDLNLNAHEVERVSTPCIEVLFAAGTAFNEADRVFKINKSSQYLDDALSALGLSDHFQRWRAS